MYLTIFSTFKDRCYSVIYLTYYISPQCSRFVWGFSILISRYNICDFIFTLISRYSTVLKFSTLMSRYSTLMTFSTLISHFSTLVKFSTSGYNCLQRREISQRSNSRYPGQFLNRQRLAVNLSEVYKFYFFYIFIYPKNTSPTSPTTFQNS